MAVPYTFASATGSIPLSYLDTNFSTPITIGNTAVTLGSTITTAYNMTLGNVIITSVGSTFPNNYLANANVILGTTTVPLGNTATTLDGLTLANVTVNSGNVTLTKVTVTTANVTTANVATLVVSGNATLGDASTDTVTVEGYMGVGGAGATTTGIKISNSALTGVSQIGFQSVPVGTSAATTQVQGVGSQPGTAVAVFTCASTYAFRANNAVKGAGSTITDQHGVYVDDQTNGTNNYGVRTIVSSGTNKWNIYASGTAQNYFAGSVGIGTNTVLDGRLNVQVDATNNISLLTYRSAFTTNAGYSAVSMWMNDSAATPVVYGALVPNITVNTAGAHSGSVSIYTTSAGTLAEKMRIDFSGNVQVSTGAVMPYAPAPAAISAATTLTNANIQGQIISATGTTYTITMPLGTTLETLATWATTNIAYDFFVINTASGIITMAVNTNVTSLGSLTIAIGASAHFRIRRTAANTFILYRLV